MQTDHAARYANQLLTDLGLPQTIGERCDHPATAWEKSELGTLPPCNLAAHMNGAMMALKALSSVPQALPNCGALLLGERAQIRNIRPNRRENAGGSARLIDTKDGRLALNMARETDWDLMPAWLEEDTQDWEDIVRAARQKSTDFLLRRAIEMGLAVAEDKPLRKPQTWFQHQTFKPASIESPLIVDLSSLWAGPLASSLLAMSGARVIKVESPQRPDGMREGNAAFYQLMNARKDCVAIDFLSAAGRSQLKRLLARADIVIEASRPRAMKQLGIIAEDYVARKPGKIWARLTAYGREQNRIGFGDDIGVSAGLSALMEAAYGVPSFVGDAIADPAAGLHVALAVQACHAQGGGAVLDFSMRDILRHAMGELPDNPLLTAKDWQSILAANETTAYPIRSAGAQARALGADNEKWLC